MHFRNKNWLGIIALMMMMLLFSFLVVQPLYAQAYIPNRPAQGRVYDEIGWFSDLQVQEINRITTELLNDEGVEIAVVTLHECGGPDNHDQFGINLFNHWELGNANTNKGFLILICWYQGDREIRQIVQRGGAGFDQTNLTNVTNKMVDSYLVGHQESEYPQQIVEMVKGYNAFFRGLETGLVQDVSPLRSVVIVLVIILVALIILRILAYFIGPSSGGGSGGNYTTTSYRPTYSSRPRGGGRAGGSGSSRSI